MLRLVGILSGGCGRFDHRSGGCCGGLSHGNIAIRHISIHIHGNRVAIAWDKNGLAIGSLCYLVVHHHSLWHHHGHHHSLRGHHGLSGHHHSLWHHLHGKGRNRPSGDDEYERPNRVPFCLLHRKLRSGGIHLKFASCRVQFYS